MRVLVVEDDLSILRLLATVFRRVGIEFDAASDGATALQKLRANSYSLLLLDLMLPVINGFEILRALPTLAPSMLARTIVMTAASESTLRDFDRSQVFAVIRKPFDLDQLLGTIARCTAAAEDPVMAPPHSNSLRAEP